MRKKTKALLGYERGQKLVKLVIQFASKIALVGPDGNEFQSLNRSTSLFRSAFAFRPELCSIYV
jgi:hypothetical protein